MVRMFGPDGLVWVFQKLLILWDFHLKPSLKFKENCQKKEKNIQWVGVVRIKICYWFQSSWNLYLLAPLLLPSLLQA